MPIQHLRQVCIKKVLTKEDTHTAEGTQHLGIADIHLNLFVSYILTQSAVDEAGFVIQPSEGKGVTNPAQSNIKMPEDFGVEAMSPVLPLCLGNYMHLP